jgi:MSHA biogenesis protein MshL
MLIMIKQIILFAMMLFIYGCAELEPEPFEPSSGHINIEESPSISDSEIPQLVEQVPVLPEPTPVEIPERYTVVVNEVPVKELLFALARDAKVNVDIHPEIEGVVTINAVEQTLPQILNRISNQIDMRYEQESNNLVITRDVPFLRTYKVDYVNLARDTESSSTVSTQISSTSGGEAEATGGGGNTSTTDVSTVSTHNFWSRLVSNISAILGEGTTAAAGTTVPVTNTVIPNPESGLLTVRATAKQHEEIQNFIDQVLVSAKRQVLIQTTIVEVTLNDRYQAGIDWSVLNQAGKAGFNFAASTLAGAPVTGALSSFVIAAVDPGSISNANSNTNFPQNVNPVTPTRETSLTGTISLLDEFGDTKILSSPQIMALNNQTALLKVVQNEVYFEIDADTTATQGVTATTFDTTARTVPVGIVMSVTPYIDAEGVITLNVRPTISRTVGDGVRDPHPNIPANIPNLVPEIAVREMESVLRMTDGQIGVLGGLMTDSTIDNDAHLPGADKVGFFGKLLGSTSAQYSKTELVIFLKPLIIRNPSVDTDLNEFKKYLSRGYKPLNRTSVNDEDNN